MKDPCSQLGATYQPENEGPVTRGFRHADGFVEPFRGPNEIRIKLLHRHAEGARKENQIIVGNPDEPGFDLRDFRTGGILHPEELEFDGKVVLRPCPLVAEPANLGSDDIEMLHGRKPCSGISLVQGACDEPAKVGDEAGFSSPSSHLIPESKRFPQERCCHAFEGNRFWKTRHFEHRFITIFHDEIPDEFEINNQRTIKAQE